MLLHLYALFFFAVESFKYSSGLNNVFIDETVNENVFERDTQKQRLGENPYLEKPILIACKNNKTEANTERTCRYTTILYSLMSEFRDVFPNNLPNGLLQPREVDHLIEVIPRVKPATKPAYRLSHSEAHKVER